MPSKKNRSMLSRAQADTLAEARTKARRSTTLVEVHSYWRHYYQLKEKNARRLARWEQLERAIVSVCSDFDRHGSNRMDKEFVR